MGLIVLLDVQNLLENHQHLRHPQGLLLNRLLQQPPNNQQQYLMLL
jgi:hypothetical protein